MCLCQCATGACHSRAASRTESCQDDRPGKTEGKGGKERGVLRGGRAWAARQMPLHIKSETLTYNFSHGFSLWRHKRWQSRLRVATSNSEKKAKRQGEIDRESERVAQWCHTSHDRLQTSRETNKHSLWGQVSGLTRAIYMHVRSLFLLLPPHFTWLT